jgi:hypothetical protein
VYLNDPAQPALTAPSGVGNHTRVPLRACRVGRRAARRYFSWIKITASGHPTRYLSYNGHWHTR